LRIFNHRTSVHPLANTANYTNGCVVNYVLDGLSRLYWQYSTSNTGCLLSSSGPLRLFSVLELPVRVFSRSNVD